MKIVKPKDTVSNRLKMLIYGKSGVGKTVFCSTAPKSLYLSAEAGLMSIMGRDDIDVIEVATTDQLREVFEFLHSGKHEYETVILDSLTEIQKRHQDALLEGSGKTKLTLEMWGANIEYIRKLCRSFRDLPMNVVLVALSAELDGEDSSTIVVRPALQGKSLPGQVQSYVDLVGYMVAIEAKGAEGEPPVTKRMIRFQPTETVSAKTRGNLDTWEVPDFITIRDKVFGKPEKAKKGSAA